MATHASTSTSTLAIQCVRDKMVTAIATGLCFGNVLLFADKHQVLFSRGKASYG